MKNLIYLSLLIISYSILCSQEVIEVNDNIIILDYEYNVGDLLKIHRERVIAQEPIKKDTISIGLVKIQKLENDIMECKIVSVNQDTNGKDFKFVKRDFIIAKKNNFHQHIVDIPTEVYRHKSDLKNKLPDTTIVFDIGIEEGDLFKFIRINRKDTVEVGFAKVQKIEGGKIICQAENTIDNNKIQKGDLVIGKKSSVSPYLTLGVLNGGALVSTNSFAGIPLQNNAKVLLNYPNNTVILNFGFLFHLCKSGSLQLFWNFGVPLRNMQMTVQSGSESVTQSLDLVNLLTDVGLIVYPLKFWKSNGRFQPFIHGGGGLNIFADSWGTIFLSLLAKNGSMLDIGFQTSYGGGFDYYISEGFGLRCSIKKHLFTLPGIGGTVNPAEIRLGIFGYSF
jgi:hypothetical protein